MLTDSEYRNHCCIVVKHQTGRLKRRSEIILGCGRLSVSRRKWNRQDSPRLQGESETRLVLILLNHDLAWAVKRSRGELEAQREWPPTMSLFVDLAKRGALRLEQVSDHDHERRDASRLKRFKIARKSRMLTFDSPLRQVSTCGKGSRLD